MVGLQAGDSRRRQAALRKQLRHYLRELNERSTAANRELISLQSFKKPITVKVRQGYVDRTVVDRFTIFLRGSGCAWMDNTGGCTFCGFWASHQHGTRVASKDYLDQVEAAIAEHREEFDGCPIVCLYNGGSMLDEAEIEYSGTEAVFRLVARHAHVREIVVEAKVTDLDEAKIAQLTDAIAPCKLTVSIGFESANEVVRDLCVNKNFPTRMFEERMDMLARLGVGTIPLLIVKPPWLREREGIEDCLASLRYLEPFRPQRIDLELPVVKRFTMMHELWKQDLYRPPRLWSIIEILRRASEEGLKTPVFWSPPNIPGDGEDVSQNCDQCNDEVIRRAWIYNESFDVGAFDNLSCICKDAWSAELAREEPACLEPLPMLERLEAELQRFLTPSSRT